MCPRKKYYIIGIGVTLLILLIVTFGVTKKCEKKDNSVCIVPFNNISLTVKVAYSKERQEKGLMNITSLKDNEGMIFVYDYSSYLSFWMKNTLIPLSIAFVEPEGRIAKIYNMKVEGNKQDRDFPVYQSPTMVRYAIEAPLGWFTLNNIGENDHINIPRELK